MDIKIYTKNIELNGESESYIRKKLNRLDRHVRSISDAKLEISRTSARSQANRVVAQITLNTGGHTLRGQEDGVNLFAAIDAVADVIDRQIRRYKGKVYRSAQGKKAGKADAARVDTSDAIEEEYEEAVLPELGAVVRTKRFPMKPMTIEDAVIQMELLSHSFFMFHNIDTDQHNVVYRRQDGDYGVIEPEMA